MKQAYVTVGKPDLFTRVNDRMSTIDVIILEAK